MDAAEGGEDKLNDDIVTVVQDLEILFISNDLYFGPKLPESVPEKNWVQTKPGMGWFAYLRLYGPEKAYFDKTWIPGDAEKIK